LTTLGHGSAIIPIGFHLPIAGRVFVKGEPYLSSQTEHSEESSTLPPPELNPLLNPLLADHMGRWAQVYFTSPPEKRDQAVQELVRELEAENAARAQSVAAATSQVNQSSAMPSSVNPSSITEHAASVAPASEVRCHACGRKNRSSQRFCGMCGTRLGEEGAAADLHRGDLHGGELYVSDQRLQSPALDAPFDFVHNVDSVQNQQSHFGLGDEDVPRDYDFNERRLNGNELSLFQSIRNESYNDDYPDEILSTSQSSGSFRFYIGLVLAIMIGAVAYMVWRGAQGTSQPSQAAPVAPPAATEPANSAPAPPTPAKNDSSERTTSAVNQTPGASRDRAQRVRNEAMTKTDKATTTLPHGISRPQSPQVETSAGTGAEELALAQRYLNGTNGQGRNSSEAARWLWKAMAKHNADAPLLLSDLYLKGDGVSKNCDQARVLLDAAALRGVKDAGQRLRHLQAFGCQ
jgi:cytoskeletal protein RodZ